MAAGFDDTTNGRDVPSADTAARSDHGAEPAAARGGPLSSEAAADDRDRALADARRELEDVLHQLRVTQEQLLSQEKLASLGALTAGIAHEIKNPLNFVTNFAELSEGLIEGLSEDLRSQADRLDPDTLAAVQETLDLLRQNAHKINEHGRRANTIVDGMLIHARGSSGRRAPTDVNALVAECVNLAFHGMRANHPGFNVAVQASYDPDAGSIDAVAADLSRVLINLINNACYAMREKQRALGAGYAALLDVRTRSLGDRVEVRLRDNGTGIAADVVERMYEPFFTTKPAGDGTGLGMPISREIVVEGHGGELAVDTAPGEFTEFAIALPRRAPAA